MFNIRYIKICSKAKHLQDKWVPLCGDWFAYEEDIPFSENFGIYLGNLKKWDSTTQSYTDNHYVRDVGGIKIPTRVFEKSKHIYLPTQRQIQDLIKKLDKHKVATDLHILSNMRITVSKLYCNSYIASCSLDEMWLIFYMKEAFEQKWLNDDKGWS